MNKSNDKIIQCDENILNNQSNNIKQNDTIHYDTKILTKENLINQTLKTN